MIAVWYCLGMPAMPVDAQEPAASQQTPMHFVASTPCSNGTKPLPGMSRATPCELMKWDLQLLSDPGKQAGTYILHCTYGVPRQGTRGFMPGEKQLHRQGRWDMVKGNSPAMQIYRLDPDQPAISVSFLRLDENLIHLLDSRQRLMIGTGAWSYTLNRIQP